MARRERGRILSSLVRWCGQFSLAEDALQDALLAAADRWPIEGDPERPAAWLTQTARRKIIDRLRRESTARSSEDALRLEADLSRSTADAEPHLPDERLRLAFVCCHPALALEARVALTLRTLGGMSTAEVARAFLVSEAAMAQRLTRARRKIALARIPFEVPGPRHFRTRLDGVLQVVYLVYNEGYLPGAGDAILRRELTGEALRLAEVLRELLPDSAEVLALSALLLLHESRSPARLDDEGELVLLEAQDRSKWDRDKVAEGIARVTAALRRGPAGRFQIEAAIAAVHAEATSFPETDWAQIALLYRELERFAPSPVVALNRAVAVGMAQGPEAGLARLAALEASDALDRYLALPLARADLLDRAGRAEEALAPLDRAIALAENGVVRRALERRRRRLEARIDEGSR